MTAFAAETDLGPPTIAWLAELGFDAYQEVTFKGSAADLVATRGSIVAVVELKRSLSFEVVAQARAWKRYAHWVLVGVPDAKPSDGRFLARQVCEDLGIGILLLRPSPFRPADLWVTPRFHRQANVEELRATLKPEHKTFAKAGQASSRRWTPFQATCEAARRYLREHPGAPMRELVAAIDHHYSSKGSAAGCLTRLIASGVVPGIRVEKGKPWRFYLDEPPAAPALPAPPSAPGPARLAPAPAPAPSPRAEPRTWEEIIAAREARFDQGGAVDVGNSRP